MPEKYLHGMVYNSDIQNAERVAQYECFNKCVDKAVEQAIACNLKFMAMISRHWDI